jgi:imidazolonepropionase-like amidohydrolase
MPRTLRDLFTPLLVALAFGAPASAETLFIKAAKVYTLSGAPLTPGQVLIKDGKIAELGTNLTAPEGAKVIDLQDGVLLPGLIDAYGQTGIAAGSATELTREITPRFRVSSAIDWRARAFKEALAGGVTAQLVAPDTSAVIGGVGCIVKSAGGNKNDRLIRDDVGLFITTTGDPGNGNSARNRPDSIYNRIPTNRMGVIWMLRQQFTAARQQTGDAEAEPLREALAGKRPAFAVARSEFEITSLLSVADETGLRNLVLVDGYESYRVARELAQRKIPVLLGELTTATALGGRSEFEKAYWNQPLDLQRAGVRFALTGSDLLDQARFAARHGLPADAALAAVTKNPAEILGIADRVGTLAAGKDADLVALSGEPLNFTTTVRFTVVGGVIFGKD